MSDKTDIGDKMVQKRIEAILWAVLVVMVITLITLIWGQVQPKAVCHAITEDSVITDCSYENGTWSTN